MNVSKKIALFFGFLFFVSGYHAWSIPIEDLGGLLLRGNYNGVTQGYNQYYSQGPTSSSTFGGWHPGIDFRAQSPVVVYSPVSGTVSSDTTSSSMNAIGRVSLKIEGTNQYFIFLHLSSKYVNAGEYISVGTPIGATGSTGTDAAHLHVEVRDGRSKAAYYFTSSSNTGYNINPSLAIANDPDIEYFYNSFPDYFGTKVGGNQVYFGDYTGQQFNTGRLILVHHTSRALWWYDNGWNQWR